MRNLRSTAVVGRIGSVLLLGVVVATACPAVWADPAAPTSKDRNIALTFATLLHREHLTRHAYDKEIYHRTITQFVKMLDPGKVYFYQSDVDGFYARQAEVEKVSRNGDVSFAHQMFQVFLARVDERV